MKQPTIKIQCSFSQMMSVTELAKKKNEKNVKEHPKNQVEILAKSIKELGWRRPIILSKKSGLIVAGHGSLEAARSLGIAKVPIDFQTFKNKREENAFAIADNRIPELGHYNRSLLTETLIDLDRFTDIDITGFSKLDIAPGKNEIQPGEQFSESIEEANNYLVLKFNNQVDWLAAVTHFKIEAKASTRRNGKKWSKGIGRVIDGATYLDSVKA